MNTNVLTFLVDDDAAYLYGTRKLLEYHKLCDTVLTFGNGRQVADFMKEHLYDKERTPDYILLDLEMPVMDGWQFLEEFLQMKPLLEKEVKVYIVSSSIDDRDKDKAKSISVITDYLVKPLNSAGLREIFKPAEQ